MCAVFGGSARENLQTAFYQEGIFTYKSKDKLGAAPTSTIVELHNRTGRSSQEEVRSTSSKLNAGAVLQALDDKTEWTR